MRLRFSIIAVCLCAMCMACSAPKYADLISSAQQHVAAGNFSAAALDYHRAIAIAPDDAAWAAATLERARLLFGPLQQPQQGDAFLQQVLDRLPLTEAGRRALEMRGEYAEQSGESEVMIEAYEQLLKYFPDHPQAAWYHLRAAEGFIMARQYAQARQELAEVLQRKQLSPEVRAQVIFDAGETYFLESNPREALNFYRALIQQYPQSPLRAEAELKIATCAEEMGYLGAAQQLMRDVAKTYPNSEAIEVRLRSLEKRGGTAPRSSAAERQRQTRVPSSPAGETLPSKRLE